MMDDHRGPLRPHGDPSDPWRGSPSQQSDEEGDGKKEGRDEVRSSSFMCSVLCCGQQDIVSIA